MRRTAFAALSVALCLTACGNDAQPTVDASASTAPSPSSSAEPSTSAGPGPGVLTGFAASREAWNAAHQPAPGFTDGAAFLPLIDGKQPKYYAVNGGAGEQILNYSVAMPPRTSFEAAKAEALKEFPAGATFDVTDKDEARCVLMRVRSPEVEKTLDGAMPMVGFFSLPEFGSAFTPSDVRTAIFTLAFEDDGQDLGMC